MCTISTNMTCHLKSLATLLYVEHYVQSNDKDIFKVMHADPLWGGPVDSPH